MKRIILLFLSLAAVLSVSAKVSLPEIIGDNMVLQQDATVKLWGWADPQASVTVAPSWGGKYTTRGDAEGRWSVQIKTHAGSYEPRQITVSGAGKGDRIVLSNVLIGEVWFAGGQSNMEMPLGGFKHCPVTGANDAIAQAASKGMKLRYVKIPHTQAYEPQERVGGRWVECSPATAPAFTAVGYFFAEMLNDALDVPVGIVDCSWGGSRVESWSDQATLSTYADTDLSREGIDAWREWLRPLVMYNAMLHPVADYTVKGFLWYQGESNVERHTDYAQRLADMASLWRSRWGEGEIPFFFVEIAPYRHYPENMGALLREAQYKAQALIPNSSMVSTNDLVVPYEAGNIHPADKRTIGRRLAYCALNRTYGMPSVACEGPQFRSVEFGGGEARVSFSHADDGFNRLEGIVGFEICGADSVFRPARVRIEGLVAIVLSEEVADPVAVRYGFRNNLPGNLGGLRGLPLVPFRSDDF